ACMPSCIRRLALKPKGLALRTWRDSRGIIRNLDGKSTTDSDCNHSGTFAVPSIGRYPLGLVITMAFTQPKASTAARGYGAAHQAKRKELAPTVAAGLATCWRCGMPIMPGQAWDLGHDDRDRSVYRGP